MDASPSIEDHRHAEASDLAQGALPSRVHICLVSINAHDRIFEATLATLAAALRDLGIEVSVAKNSPRSGTLNIVLGSIIFAAQYHGLDYLRGHRVVVYQQEQLSIEGGIVAEHPRYVEALRDAEAILDYSPSGFDFLTTIGLGHKTHYLPQQFHSSMARLRPGGERDIDVLFFGSPTPRREAVLAQLRDGGASVVHAYGIYGSELDALVARSAIVLNIHAWDAIAILETVRISFLVAAGAFVVSEASDHDPYDGTVIFAPYDDMVATTVAWLERGRPARDEAAEAARERFARTDFCADLKTALLSVEDLERRRRARMDATESGLPAGVMHYRKDYDLPLRHDGVDYLEFLREAAGVLHPRTYVEIGTNNGESLRIFTCDSLCIDPNFTISQDVLGGRRKTFFFQCRSDDFFRRENLATYMPDGIDVAFLDGLHHFEVTLRDFINVERHCDGRSVVFIHDCLPLTLNMASRSFHGGMWTGDVWRLLPILKRYRPDLKVACFDCPPTGLVACTGLDPHSTVLRDNYRAIVEDFANQPLDEDAMRTIGTIFPYYDTRRLLRTPDDLGLVFG